MGTEDGLFEDGLDESMKRAVGEMRTASQEVQAPPDFISRSMEKIRQLPPPRRRFSVGRWLSWSSPFVVPAFTAVAALLIAVPMITMYNNISRNEKLMISMSAQISQNEDLSRANGLRNNFLEISKVENNDIEKARIAISNTDEVKLCKPKKANMNGTGLLYLLHPSKKYNIIKIPEYETCSEPTFTIYLPESVLNELNLDKSSLERQEIHIYEVQSGPMEVTDATEM